MYNILCSLNFLHSANLIHRNIKPENILITDKGSIKICGYESANTPMGIKIEQQEEEEELK